MRFDSYGRPIENKRFDSFALGLAVSIIVPILVSLLLIYRDCPTDLSLLIENTWNLLGDIKFYGYVILSLMPNMFLFFVAYKTERWELCRGFVVSTILVFMIFIIRAMVCDTL